MLNFFDRLKFKIGFFFLNKKYVALYKLANGRCGNASMLYKKNSEEIPQKIKNGYKQEKLEETIHRAIKDDMWIALYDVEMDKAAVQLMGDYCSKFSNKPDRFC